MHLLLSNISFLTQFATIILTLERKINLDYVRQNYRQRLRLYAVMDCGLRSCPVAPKFERGQNAWITTETLIAYSLCVRPAWAARTLVVSSGKGRKILIKEHYNKCVFLLPLIVRPLTLSPKGCKSLMHGVVSEALASGKVVLGDRCNEGSQTAKSGTDEQERDMRHCCPG